MSSRLEENRVPDFRRSVQAAGGGGLSRSPPCQPLAFCGTMTTTASQASRAAARQCGTSLQHLLDLPPPPHPPQRSDAAAGAAGAVSRARFDSGAVLASTSPFLRFYPPLLFIRSSAVDSRRRSWCPAAQVSREGLVPPASGFWVLERWVEREEGSCCRLLAGESD